MKKKTESKPTIEKAIITFLEETKDGKFAKIDKDSFKYSRLLIQRDSIDIEENYYYGIR